jgi:hypothetical protein
MQYIAFEIEESTYEIKLKKSLDFDGFHYNKKLRKSPLAIVFGVLMGK